MGADMIGYLVKGPRKLPRNAVSLAEKELKALRERLKKNPKKCELCGSGLDENKDGSKTCDNCDGWPIISASSTNKEIKDIAKELAENWPVKGRDVCYRQDPDDPKQIIVFAGDMSWGDPPEGTGYQYLKELTASGVDLVWKIR
ncbi:MAG: hypothetical protein P9M03_08000 [Candidatus Theseobacter exili]|nr:hypothetical protein [Candidatus Theseobacter exili]